jgi:hypothetical protein
MLVASSNYHYEGSPIGREESAFLSFPEKRFVLPLKRAVMTIR